MSAGPPVALSPDAARPLLAAAHLRRLRRWRNRLHQADETTPW
jgi:hypothetical protein